MMRALILPQILAVHDQLPLLAWLLDWAVLAIELVGGAILLIGFARFVWVYADSELLGRPMIERDSRANVGRLTLARYILMALEVFIVADLLRTVLSLSLESLIYLALMVLIRTAISFLLEHEIRGMRQEVER